jgi:hypothetical protein
MVLRLFSSIIRHADAWIAHSCMYGCLQGGRCGIYGANSPEWVISMQVHLL